MNWKSFLVAPVCCLFLGWSAKADDLRNKIDALLKDQGHILGAAKSPAEGTQVYYFQATSEIFPITCTLLQAGGAFCTRGAAPAGEPKSFVVNK